MDGLIWILGFNFIQSFPLRKFPEGKIATPDFQLKINDFLSQKIKIQI